MSILNATLSRHRLPIYLGLGVAAGVIIGVSYAYGWRQKAHKPKLALNGRKQVNDSQNISDEQREELEEAQLELEKVSRAKTKKEEGNVAFRKKDYDTALNFYTLAIQICPKTHTADLAVFHHNRAACYEAQQSWHAVIEECTCAVHLHPKYLKPYLRRAHAYEMLKDYKKALHDLTRVCYMERFENESTLVRTDQVLKQSAKIDAQEKYDKREIVMPSNITVKAYLDACINDPCLKAPLPTLADGETPSGYHAARVAIDEARYADVIPACTDEINANQTTTEPLPDTLLWAYLLRGSMYLVQGDERAAELDFCSVLQIAPGDSRERAFAHVKRGMAYLQLEENDKCIADFKRALEICPRDADILALHGQILLISNGFQAALAELSKAVLLNDKHPMARAQKCFCSYRLYAGSPEVPDILSEFFKVIDEFPNYIEGYTLLAQVMCDLNRYDDADRLLERATKVQPDSAVLYVHKALLKLQQSADTALANDLLKKAIELDSRCELAYETLGTIAVHGSQLQDAVKYFETALKYAKNYGSVLHLCSLYNAAEAQIATAVHLHPQTAPPEAS